LLKIQLKPSKFSNRNCSENMPVELKMDGRDSEEDREWALLSFYKLEHQWACPVHCTLEG